MQETESEAAQEPGDADTSVDLKKEMGKAQKEAESRYLECCSGQKLRWRKLRRRN